MTTTDQAKTYHKAAASAFPVTYRVLKVAPAAGAAWAAKTATTDYNDGSACPVVNVADALSKAWTVQDAYVDELDILKVIFGFIEKNGVKVSPLLEDLVDGKLGPGEFVDKIPSNILADGYKAGMKVEIGKLFSRKS